MADLRNRMSLAWRILTGALQKTPRTGARMYAAGKGSRLMADWNPANTSADMEMVSSLVRLRARSRQLTRDASYAKRARVTVVNNIIGTGIGMQAQVMTSRGVLNERINGAIEDAWDDWCSAENCHTGGRLAFAHFERQAMGQVFEAGEVFIRKHYSRFGSSTIPYTLELIEAERMADEFSSTSPESQVYAKARMGIEVDVFHRPIAYWIRRRHPGEIRWSGDYYDLFERVPADQIIHLALIDRWPQTRGEPWMHAACRRLNDMDGYSEAEIVRARSQASMAGGIETPEDSDSFGEAQLDGSFEMEMEPGIMKRTNPGEKIILPSPTAPNPAMDPFMRYMLREVAAGVGVSYESLSRDYSQSNYSSSRLALLDDRDLWKFYQSWFITDFRTMVHKEWLKAAVMSRSIPAIPLEQYAVNPKNFEQVLFKPRGWSWIDPTKEVEAYKEAVKQGFTTVSDVIASTGGGQDIEDILNRREHELKMMRDKGLVFETSPEFYIPVEAPKPVQGAPPGKPQPDSAEEDQQETQDPAASRVFAFTRK